MRFIISLAVLSLSAPALAAEPAKSKQAKVETSQSVSVAALRRAKSGLSVGQITLRGQRVELACGVAGQALSCAGFNAQGKPVASVKVLQRAPRAIVLDAGDGVSHILRLDADLILRDDEEGKWIRAHWKAKR